MTHEEYYAYLAKAQDALEHHGIKGQRWGLRRYQNYDGSYTQAGVKRYLNSEQNYKDKKDQYEAVKANKKFLDRNEVYVRNGDDIGPRLKINKTMVKSSRDEMKNAKRQMNKDYKHLKQDKLADKGKARYARGERITESQAITRKIASASASAAVASQYMAQMGYLDKKTANLISSTAAVASGAATVKSLIDYKHARELRAYYGHTSKY